MSNVKSTFVDCIELLGSMTGEDIKSLDSATLNDAQDKLRFLNNWIATVAAQKRVLEENKEEMAQYTKKIEDFEAAHVHVVNGNESFDNLAKDDRDSIVAYASLYFHARRQNNVVAMEKIKSQVMQQLSDVGLATKHILAHVLNLAE